MAKPLYHCRICGNEQLVKVLDLGEQALTGVFPADAGQPVTRGPLQLVKCHGEERREVCGLLQLAHSYDFGEMYGENYGYRSGLNPSMVEHLQNKVQRIVATAHLSPGDLILDIGSNDSTTLRAYPEGYHLVGIDPTGTKFKPYYPPHIRLISDYFSLAKFREHFGNQKAKVVTSFSMFYDLEAPMSFMMDIRDILDDDGIWVFEQSYMPAMLDQDAYDTVCHEHLEYYGLTQIKWMADRIGLRIVDVEFNDVNGGSFSVTVSKQGARLPSVCDESRISSVLDDENRRGLASLVPYQEFADRVSQRRAELTRFLIDARERGEKVYGLGASTKGNVLLQYCGIRDTDIRAIGEVNPEKFGHVTPGTLLPIVPEQSVLASAPDFLLVLPWHFRRFFESSSRFKGHRLVFPLPRLEMVEVR